MLFYDFEVFHNNWMVVIKNAITNQITTIIDDHDLLYHFYEEHKDNIWIGYNSRHYDQWILKSIVAGLSPQDMNKHIIEKKQHGATFSSLVKTIQLYNYDVMNTFHGLKQLEGFMGESIKETSVPFDVKRELTKKEIKEVISYCRHDVEQTQNVFEATVQEFESQLSLLKAFQLPLDRISKTKPQLAATILGAISKKHDDEFNLNIPDTIRLNKYDFIRRWYENPSNLNYESNLKVDIAGVPHVFAWGGLHGAVTNYISKEKGVYISSDVASYYPSLMIEYGFVSRNIKDPKKYAEIYQERLRLKALKDPKQAPYKIVLNSTYGAMKDKYNALYDPLQANNVCVSGQLMLLDLIEKVEYAFGNKAKLIQSNTDGIMFRLDSEDLLDEYISICDEWCNRTRMGLEHDKYVAVYQKDVNNYIIVDEKGDYKSKGAYVKKLGKLDYDLPIVNKAVVNNLIHGIPVEDTINQCDSLIEFQKIVKISSKYLYGTYGTERLSERVLRVFASRSMDDKGVFKVKKLPNHAGNITDLRVEKIANTPERCFLVNDNILGAKVPRKLDRQYYIDIANKRLNDFRGL